MNLTLASVEAQGTTTGRGNEANRTPIPHQTEVLNKFVARIVRRRIAEQYVGSGHPVLVDEDRMIAESEAALMNCLEKSGPPKSILVKMLLVRHIHRLARQRLMLQDIDDETREIALESIVDDDFERIFPASWSES